MFDPNKTLFSYQIGGFIELQKKLFKNALSTLQNLILAKCL